MSGCSLAMAEDWKRSRSLNEGGKFLMVDRSFRLEQKAEAVQKALAGIWKDKDEEDSEGGSQVGIHGKPA
jgi:hypothetical protein